MKKVETKTQYVRIKTTDGSTFRGTLNLNSETKNMDRLSDFFTKGKNPFITLYEVTAQGRSDVFIINKDHIVWVTPEEDL